MLKLTGIYAKDCRHESGEQVRFVDLDEGAYFIFEKKLFRKIETLEGEVVALELAYLNYYALSDDDIVDFVPNIEITIPSKSEPLEHDVWEV